MPKIKPGHVKVTVTVECDETGRFGSRAFETQTPITEAMLYNAYLMAFGKLTAQGVLPSKKHRAVT